MLGEYDQNVTVDPQGTTVLNVYYDRQTVTLTFRVYDYTYTATTGNDGTQYGYVTGLGYVQLTRNGSNPNYTWTYDTGEYEYTATTGNNGTQYGLVNGSYVQLERYGNTWYYYANGYQTYTGTRYTRTSITANYTSTRYTRSNNRSWQDYQVMTGLYQQTLAQAGYTWPDEYWWYDNYQGNYGNYSGSGTRTTFLAAFYLSNGSMSQTFYGFTGSGTNHVYFYTEALDGSWTLTNTMTSSGGTFYISDKYEGFTAAAYSTDNTNWTPLGDKDSEGYYGSVSNSGDVYVRYTRNSYTLTFMPNYDGEVNTTELTQDSAANRIAFVSGMTGSEKKTFTVTIPYGQTFSSVADVNEIVALQGNSVADADKYPLIPNEYKFDGWFVDQSTTTKFNLSDTMPAGNLMIYAGMSMIKYRIIIDPNGGVMDHINYNTYLSSLADTGLKGTNSDGTGYNDAYATYFNNTAAEFISTDQEIDNPMVQIDSREEAQLLADYQEALNSGGSPTYPIYRYVNMQYDKGETVQQSGHSYHSYAADARNAVYILDTEASITAYYNYYVAVLAAKNDGEPIARSTWETLFLSTQKYRLRKPNETYDFLGWYEVNETTGEIASTPYDFSQPTSHRTKLQAQWRLKGGYVLHYTPSYTWTGEENGAAASHALTGSMDEFYDPDPDSTTNLYTDGAFTQAMQEPSAVTEDGVPTEDYQFRGWQIVRVSEYGGVKHYTVPDEEVGVYYTAGQTITVKGRYAQEELAEDGVTTMQVIHLRAVYEKRDEAYRRPNIINLTINASQDGWMATDGTTHTPQGQGYVNTDDSTTLPTWTRPGHQYIDVLNTKTVAGDAQPYLVLFGDAQSNAAIHLYKYATAPGEVAADGHNYFTHELGYRLIGFDLDAPDNDFIPTYPADSVIAVSPGTSHTLYAVWEPMVYISFVNDTGVGPITFNLDGTGRSMYIVNKTSGAFSRVPLDASQPITLAAGETLMLAAPYGEGENITASGTNTLGTGYMITASTELGTTSPTARSFGAGSIYEDVPNNSDFTLKETLVLDPEGIVITFTAKRAPHTLILDDNYAGGGTKEVNFSSRASDKLVYYQNESTTSYTLPSTSTRVGFELVGWDEDPDKGLTYDPDNSSTFPTFHVGSWSITDLSDFFTSALSSEPDIQEKTLYAIWHANTDASTVYVWKDVPQPGDQSKDFTFTVSLGGDFTYTESQEGWWSYSWRGSSTAGKITAGNGKGAANGTGTAVLTYAFTLKHNQFLKIVTEKQEQSGGGRPYITMTVTKWQRDNNGVDTQLDDADDQTAGNQSQVVLKWYWTNPTLATGANATATNQYKDFSFGDLSLSVTESDYTSLYNLNAEIASETVSGALTANNSSRNVTWGQKSIGSTDAGATVVFHNIRKTANVTIKKTLLPSTLDAGSFPYTVKFLDNGGNEVTSFETYNLSLTSFSVISGDSGYTINGIPTGARLKISETVDDNTYETTASAVSAASVSDLNAADNVFTFDVAADTTVTFTNTLRSKYIRVILKDDSDPANALSGGTFTFPGVFEGNKFAADPSGIVYEGIAYVGSYTLTEQTGVGVRYQKLASPATVAVTKNNVTVTPGNANDIISVTGGTGTESDPYVITIVNPQLMLVTVRKAINAQAPFRTGTFGFTATLTDSSNNSIAIPAEANSGVGTISGNTIEFTLVHNQFVQLYVPKNSKLTVEEIEDAAFTPTYQVGTSLSTAQAATSQNGRTALLSGISEDKYILFTNTLKTIQVTVTKKVDGTGGTFNFNAFLRYNGAAVQGYTLASGITTGDGTGGTTAGRVNFALSVADNSSASIVFTIPSGSVLQLTETIPVVDLTYFTTASGTYDSDPDPDNTFGTFNASNLTITLSAVQTVEDLTVTFTNTEIHVAPTGIDFDNIPFVMMAILGLLLCLIAVFGRKARREEMALAAAAVEVEAVPEEKSAQITEASAKAEAAGKRPRKPMQAVQGCREWAGCVWHASKEYMRIVRRRIRSGPCAPPG